MSPELQILAINAVFLGYAYVWAYPRTEHKTAIGIAWRDTVTMGAALMMGASSFAKANHDFDLIVATSNWFIFQLITYAIMQTPLFAWFLSKHHKTL